MFILKNLNPQEFQWTQNKADVSESAELYYYVLDKILIEKDGSIVLVGEQRYRYYINPNNIEPANAPPNYYAPRTVPFAYNRLPNSPNNRSLGPYVVSTRMYYNAPAPSTFNNVANNILVAKLDPSGQIIWSQKILKSQNTLGDEGLFSSYLVERILGKLCFFFDDDARNVSLSWTEQPKIFNGKKPIVSIVSLDEEGNQFKQWIYNSADIDVTVIPKMSKLLPGNELILFGRKPHHQQIGRLTFR